MAQSTPDAQFYQPRVQNLFGVFGTATAVAETLGVTAREINKWKRGESVPAAEQTRLLLDVDFIIARARLVLHADAIRGWMAGPNQFLSGGTTPLVCLRLGLVAEVVQALRAEEEGAYA